MTQNRPNRVRKTTSGTKALYGVSKIAKDASTATSTTPLTPPTNLRKAELAIWHETVAAMQPGFFTAADRRMLAAFCRNVVLAEKLHEIIAEKPAVMYPPHGATKLNPAFAVWAKATVTCQSLARELGLTPLARKAFLSLSEPVQDDNGATQLSA